MGKKKKKGLVSSSEEKTSPRSWHVAGRRLRPRRCGQLRPGRILPGSAFRRVLGGDQASVSYRHHPWVWILGWPGAWCGDGDTQKAPGGDGSW